MVSAGGLALESVSITHAPNKTEYATGDTFDKTGMVVTANFNNDVSFVTTDYTVSPETLTAAVTAVTISVTVDGVTRTTTQAVMVLDKATLTYTGTMTHKQITSGGTQYTLYEFTTSGTLTIKGSARNTDIWACGGGGSPALIRTSAGGGGGYTAQLNGQTLSAGQYVITIGAAEAATSITRGGTALLTANGAPVLSGGNDANRSKGGSGGGSTGGYVYSAPGQGTTTRPFGDTANFVSIPCAGGGGGGGHSGERYGRGGDGGSNGSNGKPGSEYSTDTEPYGGKGGNTGGGKGSSEGANGASYAEATAATYYGGGGGGARTGRNAGYGYQGWLLIRIPV